MSLWVLALVAAGAAVAGSLSCAWFARPMGHQAKTVLPEILKEFGDAAHTQREREFRRPAYLEFLVRVNAALGAADPSGTASLEERRAVSSALNVMVLVGPANVVEAAQHLASLVHDDHWRSPSDVEHARTAFLTAARSALSAASSVALSPDDVGESCRNGFGAG